MSEVSQVISQGLMPALNLVASAIVSIFLILLVVSVNPLVALSTVVLLGGAYSILYAVLRHYIARIGAERVKANQERFKIAQEALGGIKDVKVLGLENGYIRSFAQPARRFARVQLSSQVINQIPQFALQGLAFGGMLLTAWVACR
ncbi:MAG: ABC transporter transmembrane domain-containing protein [Gammaproteobacteria bacterium]|nr:ABC transporter transmembrane domain-containing protein [Gammaproteobacteria bacterium]